MARPTKLTPELAEVVLRMIRTGLPLARAAEAAGLAESTLHAWLKRGDTKSRKKSEQIYKQFRDDVEKARAEAEAILVARIGNAAQKGSWQAAAFLLERQYPERWAKPTGKENPSDSKPDDPFSKLDEHDEVAARREARKGTA